MNTYDNIVTKEILKSNQFGITDVNDIESIKGLSFNKDQYLLVTELIAKKDWDSIKKIEEKFEGFREYLDVIKFSNQNKELFIATVYDSDELLQDPEIIDIFKL